MKQKRSHILAPTLDQHLEMRAPKEVLAIRWISIIVRSNYHVCCQWSREVTFLPAVDEPLAKAPNLRQRISIHFEGRWMRRTQMGACPWHCHHSNGRCGLCFIGMWYGAPICVSRTELWDHTAIRIMGIAPSISLVGKRPRETQKQKNDCLAIFLAPTASDLDGGDELWKARLGNNTFLV